MVGESESGVGVVGGGDGIMGGLVRMNKILKYFATVKKATSCELL